MQGVDTIDSIDNRHRHCIALPRQLDIDQYY